MPKDLFVPARDAWSARPTDPNDVFLSERVQRGAAKAQVGLFGVPFDGAVIGRKGARGGPAAIRAELARLKPWTMANGPAELDLADWGDVALAEGASVEAAHEAVERAAAAVIDAGGVPLALGGDHSLTFPLVKAVARGGRRVGVTAGLQAEDQADLRMRVGVINLDAHLDVRDVVDGRLNSGQSFGRLLEAGLVKGPNLVEVGIRDFANAPAYADKARRAGATILAGRDVSDRGAVAVMEHAVEVASRDTDGVYLSVDLDVLDQSHAPGVSAPTPGGLTTRELYDAVRIVAQRATLVGADFVEVAPNLDRDGMTARAAAYAVMHLVAGVAARRA